MLFRSKNNSATIAAAETVVFVNHRLPALRLFLHLLLLFGNDSISLQQKKKREPKARHHKYWSMSRKRVEYVFRRNTEISGAVEGATVALFLVVAERVEFVVEGEFGSDGNVAVGEESDASVAVDAPLLRVAVRIATVVHEATVVALGTSVDNPAKRNLVTFYNI